MDCIFCQTASGKIPAKIIYQDEKIIAFDDLHPRAPIHKLIIPKKHFATLNDIQPEDEHLLGHMFTVAKNLAKKLGVAETGYRIITNCNKDGGQEVYHLHMHLLGGRSLHWPPG